MSALLILAAFVFSLLAFTRTRRTMERLDREMAVLREEVARLSARPHIAVSPEPEADEAAVSGDLPNAAASADDPAPVETEDDPEAVAIPVDAPPLAARETLENRLGARWAVWIGGVALALGGVFLVKVSIDAGLLGPAVRLVLATLFGLALLAGGEGVRRHILPGQGAVFTNAMVPGILTAAGGVTLLGVAYAAHAIYGFIGPTSAFALMALVCFAILGLSLVHGQALAGLGLAASLVTPLLVSSESPSPWSLFGFLGLVWLATFAAARIGRWRVVPALANLGLCLWALAYLSLETSFVPLPVTVSLLILIAGHGLVWPAGTVDISGSGEGTDRSVTTVTTLPGPWRSLLLPPLAPVVLTGGLAVLLTALALISPVFVAGRDATVDFAVLTVALALLAALRPGMAPVVIAAGLSAVLGVLLLTALMPDEASGMARSAAFGLSAAFIALAALALARHGSRQPFAVLWSALAAVTSVACCAISFIMVGTIAIDVPHGVASLLFAAAFLLVSEGMARRAGHSALAQGFLLAGLLGHLVIAAHALSEGLWTTLAIAIAAAAFVGAMRVRSWPALPWIGAAGFLVVLARIAWEPTIVGPLALGRTPVFNALLPGYGIPALLALVCAFALRRAPSERLRNTFQAIASLFSLLTLAILVRHAMNGGQLAGGAPSLAEQSIYTLLVIGASAILLRLDLGTPGRFLRYGGMAMGIVSLAMVASAHLVGLNPYLTGELLGTYPLADLLLIGYLLPGLAYAAVARAAVGRRPPAYVSALAIAAAVMVFAWATLSVRRFWQGQGIADWKGFLPGETYTYSVVWLLLGVALLALGSRLDRRSLRVASAIVVLVTVMKVFLIDMSNLEGLLRALSFIGLGAVLIGIGLFYQKLLTRTFRVTNDGKTP